MMPQKQTTRGNTSVPVRRHSATAISIVMHIFIDFMRL